MCATKSNKNQKTKTKNKILVPENPKNATKR